MAKKSKIALLTSAFLITMISSMFVQAASQDRLIQRDKLNTTIDEFKHELRHCRTHIEKKMMEKPIDMQDLQTYRLKCRIKLERQLGTMLIALSDIGTDLDVELAERNGPVQPKHTGK